MPDIIEVHVTGPDEITMSFDGDADEIVLTADSVFAFSSGGSGGDAETLQGRNSAYHLDRTNHTGTQAQSTVTGLVTKLAALDQTDIDQQAQIDLKLDAADYNDRYKGLFTSYYELELAWPTASAGDKAQVDWGLGTDVVEYAWDVSDQYWAAIGIASVSSTDQLPEGSSNLYHTGQRVRDTALSGLSLLSSLAITAADSVLSAFGKLQAQISALATVAQTGSYNDLSDKPTINEAEKKLVHKTETAWKSRSSVGNLAPFDLAQRGVFDSNFIIPANTLVAGDMYRLEMTLFIDIVSAQSGNYEIAPIFNDGLFPFSPTSVTISLGIMNVSQSVQVVFDITFPAVGASGRIIQSGILTNRNSLAFFTSNTSPIDTTQPVSLNYSARFTSTVGAGNSAHIKSARLYKLNDPS